MNRIWVLILGVAGILAALLITGQRNEPRILVAVASNFESPARELSKTFSEAHGIAVELIPGSSGVHLAQIQNGAPYDLFLAADRKRPERLEASGIGVGGTRRTYAVGGLVFWSRLPNVSPSLEKALRDPRLTHVAIANPDLAPYGAAAHEVLQRFSNENPFPFQVVKGENVAQAFHFVETGAAQGGLLAKAQRIQQEIAGRIEGHCIEVPKSFHSPIEQQAILLKDSEAARRFLDFLTSPEALKIIRQFGYETP